MKVVSVTKDRTLMCDLLITPGQDMCPALKSITRSEWGRRCRGLIFWRIRMLFVRFMAMTFPPSVG
jgi:hypothetical protein